MPTEDDDKKLLAKRKQRELTEEEKVAQARQQAENDVARRIAMRNRILKEYVPALTGGGPGPEGHIGKASHLSSMQAEGVAAALMMDLIVFLVQLLFNTPYLVHKSQFNKVLKRQMSEYAKGNNLQLVYMPDEKGNYPDVYKIDEDGEIDFTQMYENGQAPREAVRKNGFVPKPSLKEGYFATMDMHMERMWGSGILNDDQKLRLRNMIEDAGPEARKTVDKVRDNAILQRMRPNK